MGRITNPDGPDTVVFASETCAFDLINATYVNDVEPGEMVCIGPEGLTRERWAPETPHVTMGEPVAPTELAVDGIEDLPIAPANHGQGH